MFPDKEQGTIHKSIKTNGAVRNCPLFKISIISLNQGLTKKYPNI